MGVLAISSAAILVRLAFAAAGSGGMGISLVVAAIRMALAALLLAPAWWNLRSMASQPRGLLDGSVEPSLLYSGGAGLCLALHFATWIASLSYTSIAASTAIVTTNPIWVVLFAWLGWREVPTRTSLGGIAIALAGGLLVGWSDAPGITIGEGNPRLGNGLALIGAWAVSLYFLLGRTAQRRGMGLGSHAAIAYGTAALFLLPLPCLWGNGYSGFPRKFYLYTALLAVFPQLVGHTSFNWAVRWLSPTVVTLIILLEPVGAGVLGIVVFGEMPGPAVLGGAVLLLVGVAIAAMGSRTLAAGGE